MLKDIFSSLIEKEENLWLEFKSYWYWTANNKKIDLGINEFLKDFASMFNTIDSHVESERYLIFGFDEKTKEHNDFNMDKDKQVIEYLNNLVDLKKDLVKKLKNRFVAYPEYRGSNELTDIGDFFDIREVDYKGIKNLVFSFNKVPYLLKLNADLGNGIKKGSFLIRQMKTDGTPENVVCDIERIEELRVSLNIIKDKVFPRNETTIRKIVEAFKNKHMPYANYISDIAERNYNTGICYELFRFQGEYASPITFIYFTTYTTQGRTLDYLVEQQKIKEGDQIIVLLDRYNKTGGIIDIRRIDELFKAKLYKVEIYYMEDFSLEKLYQELLDNDVFYKGQALTNNFVKPYAIQSDDKTADILLNEWYENYDNPLIVLKGHGGVGKTTMAKYFLERIYKVNKNKNIHILYINSHDIINEIMKRKNIEDIFDFYIILAEKKNVSKKFSKELLSLSSDNGNLIIVLDGIDEVIAKKGSDFNLNALVNSIFENYSGNLNKTKIIMTCRDFYWETSNNNDKVKTIELKPFDENLARKYFEKSFGNDNKKIRDAMKLACNFQRDGLYVPYILDMIKDNMVSVEKNAKPSISTNILNYKDDIDDYLIAKSCEREIIKLENLDIDDQVKIFVKIAVEYDGTILESHLQKILKQQHADKNLHKFNDHALLRKSQDALSFRYDFFTTHFKCIGLYNFMKNKEISSMDSSIADLFIQYIAYENGFVKNLQSRLGLEFRESLKTDLFFLTTGEYRLNAVDNEKLVDVNSALFTLVLSFFNNIDKDERTTILKEIYQNESGYIEKLNIINLHSKNKNLIFDFSNLKFNNCYFENYENFSDCNFNENTIFKNTIFKPSLIRRGMITNISRCNVDFSTCQTVGIDEILEYKEMIDDQEVNEVRKNLKRIISYFWHGGYFSEKLASEANNRFKNINNTFQKLIDLGVIKSKRVTTTQKRQDLAYQISNDYLDLRKIFEENETCIDFELLIKELI